MPMDSLLAEFSRLHFPNAPATPAQISAFEARVGWKLDEELRAFYLHANGGTLFTPPPNTKYCFLSLDEIVRARVAIRGRDQDSAGPASHFTLVDMQDTNFVVVDVAKREAGHYPLLDAFHETYPDEVPRIASSFEEFLEKALRSGNRSFWLSSEPPEE
ncbi:SMI1/KNR4 family protein [Corallococcus carmarthensis]|uniref:SMI1/KNR4 family protein n=1 Tax=Corallococcus carmarthensis TaxID=2316728 RepID=A0A3A8KA43_9BACT|nr:SMI1/KNR4 family protein [Corallococcus carmarthensis]NOK15915.1 SMI1/KNR4 family protein [Corallococcus carmarthensis]RKH05033.1 SMI1/KNR4 family protein [Corallococcus carmarthensis]